MPASSVTAITPDNSAPSFCFSSRAVPSTMQVAVIAIVIRRSRQKRSAYSALMSARNHPNQSVGVGSTKGQ